jgi:hypothetical protein
MAVPLRMTEVIRHIDEQALQRRCWAPATIRAFRRQRLIRKTNDKDSAITDMTAQVRVFSDALDSSCMRNLDVEAPYRRRLSQIFDYPQADNVRRPMKYLVTYLAVSALFAILANSVGQMASRTGDVRLLNRWLRLLFSANLVAAVLWWAQPPSSASLAVYVLIHLALVLCAAIDLRAAYGRISLEGIEADSLSRTCLVDSVRISDYSDEAANREMGQERRDSRQACGRRWQLFAARHIRTMPSRSITGCCQSRWRAEHGTPVMTSCGDYQEVARGIDGACRVRRRTRDLSAPGAHSSNDEVGSSEVRST